MPDEIRDVRVISSIFTPQQLSLRWVSGTEGVGDVFEYRVSLLSPQTSLDLVKVLGSHMTIELDLPNNQHRYFDGIVTRFGYEGMDGKVSLYTAVLRPWVWLLTRRRNSRIFQKKTALDIIKQIFSEQALSSFKDSTTAPEPGWRNREYCVQYNESDFDFISRLMEEEGIYYYFEHTSGHHQMILVNAPTAHSVYPGYGTIPLETNATPARLMNDVVLDWRVQAEIQTDKVVYDDYYYQTPSANLQKTQEIKKRPTEEREYEAYTYPGHYTVGGDGNHYARVRIEEYASRFERARGEASARGLAAGYLFTLDQPERPDQGKQYLVLKTDFDITAEVGTQTGPGGARPFLYHCFFEAIIAKTPYHSPRRTPWPVVPGPQTALVVGTAGQEIDTDKFLSVKVQFYWDRVGTKDQNSSCWICVAQSMAGKNFGAVIIPRMGQEVVVEFLEGNPDTPLVTGVVYNNQNLPPYDLPANKTRSTFKTRSTLNGAPAEFNELRFEDLKGSEEIFMHAQKDYNGIVLNNYTLVVTQDMKEQVKDGNRTVLVDTGDQTTTVKTGNRTTTIKSDEKLTVQSGDMTTAVQTGKRTTTIMQNDQLTVESGNRSVTVTAGDDSLTVTAGDMKVDVTAGSISISAGQKIELKVGDSSITIDNMGVSIAGMQIKSEAQLTNSMKSLMTEVAGDVTVKVSGLMSDFEGSAMTTLKGGIVMIN